MGIFEDTSIVKVNQITGTISKTTSFQITGTISNRNIYDDTTWERKIIGNSIVDPDRFTLIIDHDGNTLRAL